MATTGATVTRPPNLLIAGVPKAATTSLYGFLVQHPDVAGGVTKEIDYFTPLRDPDGRLGPFDAYVADFAPAAAARWRVDGSPSYAIGGPPVIDAICDRLGDVRVIICLREPVSRFWSSYTFLRAQGYLDDVRDVTEYLDRCLAARERGTDRALGSHVMALSAGAYDEYVPAWLDAFGDDLRLVFAEDLAADPIAVVASLFDWLGLDPAPADSLDATRRNRTVEPRSRQVARLVYGVGEAVRPVLDRAPGLRRGLRSLYGRFNTRPVQEVMPDVVRERLRELYRPHVAALARDLHDRGHRDLPGWLSETR